MPRKETIYLTPEDAATRLQLSADTVKDLLRKRMLPGRKVGGVWRIHPDHLDEFLRASPAPNAA